MPLRRLFLLRSLAMSQQHEFSHLDEKGRVRMVSVGEKSVTSRRAVASAKVVFPAGILQKLVEQGSPKGDVAAAARIAGISAAKKTSDLIPLCHGIAVSGVEVDFRVCEPDTLEVTCAASADARTGVEMEALVGASVAALTVYDMCKALSKGIRITDVALVSKTGGRSGDWNAASPAV